MCIRDRYPETAAIIGLSKSTPTPGIHSHSAGSLGGSVRSAPTEKALLPEPVNIAQVSLLAWNWIIASLICATTELDNALSFDGRLIVIVAILLCDSYVTNFALEELSFGIA